MFFVVSRIPNWGEVPIEITGCEKRCFCEDGELDCQEICSPLPALPPSNLRCPIGHRPAPVAISEDDCCKEWGCISTGKNNLHMNKKTLTFALFSKFHHKCMPCYISYSITDIDHACI